MVAMLREIAQTKRRLMQKSETITTPERGGKRHRSNRRPFVYNFKSVSFIPLRCTYIQLQDK